MDRTAPASLAPAHGAGIGPLERLRRASPWWLYPAAVVTVLSAFGAYSVWTAFFSGGVNRSGPYL
ncbi:MAG: hypothetical protein JOY68_10765, partial [Candidatus Dormibacteraeota bacterium]|nr:hypothetical protein [Candidatus Dormibacteraeota bacterium]